MILGPPTGYTDILNEATIVNLRKDRDSGKQYQKTPIRPSSAGECARALYMDLLQFSGRAKFETELLSPETVRLFSLGHSVEWNLIDQFYKSGAFEIRYKQQSLSFAYLESKSDPKLAQWFEGSLDMVLWSPQHKCVVDVKSKKDRFSAGHKSAWDDQDEKLGVMKSVQRISDTAYWVEDLEAFLAELNDPFFSANFKQLNMYACSTFLRERGIDHGSIIQYSKNDSRLREVRFKPSLALYEATILKMQNVIRAVDEDKPELAPKEFMLGSVKCAYCKFKNYCWPNVDVTKAFYKTLPAKEWPRDTDRMGKAGADIEKLFEARRTKQSAEDERDKLETEILFAMKEKGVEKIRLENGEVWLAKQNKDAIVLRRSKA